MKYMPFHHLCDLMHNSYKFKFSIYTIAQHNIDRVIKFLISIHGVPAAGKQISNYLTFIYHES